MEVPRNGQWMVCIGTSYTNMDLGVPPFQETPIWINYYILWIMMDTVCCILSSYPVVHGGSDERSELGVLLHHHRFPISWGAKGLLRVSQPSKRLERNWKQKMEPDHQNFQRGIVANSIRKADFQEASNVLIQIDVQRVLTLTRWKKNGRFPQT